MAVLALFATVSCGQLDGLYAVSGTVFKADAQGNKTPLPGIVVALSGTRSTVKPVAPIVLVNTDVTDANGHYSIRTASGNYKVSAGTPGYDVTPNEYVVNEIHADLAEQDFVAVVSE